MPPARYRAGGICCKLPWGLSLLYSSFHASRSPRASSKLRSQCCDRHSRRTRLLKASMWALSPGLPGAEAAAVLEAQARRGCRSARQISPTGVPASPWRRAIAICSSLNLLFRIRSILLSGLTRGCGWTETLPRKREPEWINFQGQEPLRASPQAN